MQRRASEGMFWRTDPKGILSPGCDSGKPQSKPASRSQNILKTEESPRIGDFYERHSGASRSHHDRYQQEPTAKLAESGTDNLGPCLLLVFARKNKISSCD